MENYLSYDINDLKLTEVHNNSERRKLLMKTSSKLIIVIEDFDCSINVTNKKKINNNPGIMMYYDPEMRCGSGFVFGEDGGNSITLLGLLNFIDGLWSYCGSERIFVFTTNHIGRLDLALLISERMDMHIYMSYCSYPALKILLKNYLGYEESDLDGDILKELAKVVDKSEMTPTDISEVSIKSRRYKQKAISDLLEALKTLKSTRVVMFLKVLLLKLKFSEYEKKYNEQVIELKSIITGDNYSTTVGSLYKLICRFSSLRTRMH
ncbi:hypothetical protein CRYUN_Cryun07bG0047900 [Craigia yunnanensis]